MSIYTYILSYYKILHYNKHYIFNIISNIYMNITVQYNSLILLYHEVMS